MSDTLDYNSYLSFTPEEQSYAQDAFGGTEAFINKYGMNTPDGTPRFGEDYAFLVHPDELNEQDRRYHDQEVANGEVIVMQTGKVYKPDEEKSWFSKLFGI